MLVVVNVGGGGCDGGGMGGDCRNGGRKQEQKSRAGRWGVQGAPGAMSVAGFPRTTT